MDSIVPFKPLTKDGVAEVFGISIRTVENWVNEGLLPAPTTIGHRVFWHPGVFYGWLHDRLRTPAGHLVPESPQPPVTSGAKRRSATNAASDHLHRNNRKRLAGFNGTDEEPA